MNLPRVLVCLVAIVATSIEFSPSVEAGGGCIPGSYFAMEGSGTRSLWTLSSDGTFQATSSAESALNFSHIQGTWRRDGAHTARIVGLDFGFLSQPVGAGVPPQWITRIDAALQFSHDCRQFSGGFELRFYDVTEDPLDAATAMPAGSDTLSARRIEVP